jgi:type IV pilus assembly protein PilC
VPKFAFQARAANGNVQNGQMDAADESEARVKLRAKNLVPIRLTLVANSKIPLGSTKAVNSRELQIFTRQFSTLIDAGIPIVDALKILGEGKRNPVLVEAANKICESIQAGRRLGESMAQHPKIFDRFYVNMVRAGEEAGILDGILSRLSIYMEKSEKIKGQVRGALAYPIIIIIVATLVIAGILVFIIPKFQDLYANSGKALPALTQMVVNLSQFLVHKWYVLFGTIGACVYLIYIYSQSTEGKRDIDNIVILTPLFGDVVQKSSIARMSRTLSTLLSSGVSVIDALEIAASTSGNRVIEEALIRSKESVIAGRPLAAPLSQEKMIPDMVTQMISIGERSGTMDTMFSKIADFYEDEVESSIKVMTSMIEPIMMVVLGGVIAFLVLAMYLPIFDIASLGSK